MPAFCDFEHQVTVIDKLFQYEQHWDLWLTTCMVLKSSSISLINNHYQDTPAINFEKGILNGLTVMIQKLKIQDGHWQH